MAAAAAASSREAGDLAWEEGPQLRLMGSERQWWKLKVAAAAAASSTEVGDLARGDLHHSGLVGWQHAGAAVRLIAPGSCFCKQAIRIRSWMNDNHLRQAGRRGNSEWGVLNYMHTQKGCSLSA